PVDEAVSYLKAKPSIEILSDGDMVEIMGGPFKGMRARVISVNKDRGEVTVELLDTPYTMPITMYAEYVRKVSEKSS
ncbi:MAG: KOW motif-containing protein, partial [Candidatus Bathyarchaeota archaeon]|nr:KOW motif-containing protein [Candidatus Bathyarchaeota archaeon]